MKFQHIKPLEFAIHLIFWISLFGLFNSHFADLSWGPFSRREDTLRLPLLYGLAINALLFYFNLLWLIPEMLHRKRIRSFAGWSLVLLIGLSVIEIAFDFLYLHSFGLAGLDEPVKALILEVSAFMVLTFVVNTLWWAMAFLYRFPKDWMRNERQKQQLIHDKLSAEL